MRVALVNPPWDFKNSIYFGCREPHLPLELGYAKACLERDGHDVLLVDAHLFTCSAEAAATEVAAFEPGMTVVTTAPSYLFWRCAPPEMRVPRQMIQSLDGRGGTIVVVGPHGSATPRATMRKLGAEVVIRGECEEAIAALARAGRAAASAAIIFDGAEASSGTIPAPAFVDAPPLQWPDEWIARHHHHHHRFEQAPDGPGAEVEASRGCPYACTFCAKIDFRDRYRRRSLSLLLDEIDHLLASGVRYLYFIDEIFLPQRALLEALIARDLRFGVQTRLDLWKPELIDLLGKAGCVSIEAGVESLSREGRAALDKDCRLSTDELTRLLVHARRRIPFVQANLIATKHDRPDDMAAWRDSLRGEGVWANDPVPLFPYPSSPVYRSLWGEPDDAAWERALDHYLAEVGRFSDIQEKQPLPLGELERACLPA